MINEYRVRNESENHSSSAATLPPGVIYDSKIAATEKQKLSFSSRARTWIRFLLIAITLLCLTSIWSNILAFNFVMVCLKSDADSNETSNGHVPRFSTDQRTYLTSAVAIAALISNFFILPILTLMGVRTIFTVCGGISVIATAFMPIGIRTGFYTALLLRILQGIAFSSAFPAIWIRRFNFSRLGWSSVFYGHAIVTAVLFIIFVLIYRNSPSKHPLVTTTESTKIAINKAVQSKSESRNIPYMEILKTPAVWAVWIASIGNFTFVNMVFLYSPTYFHNTLGMEVAESGLSAAVPAGLEFLLKISCGLISDKVKCFNETNRLRFYNTVAYFGASGVLGILCFIDPSENSTICFLLLSIATAFLGFTTGGFFKSGPMIAKQYSQFVTGNVSLGLTLTMIIVPFVKNGIAPMDSAENWRKIFFFMIGILVITNIIFCIFCSAEPAKWTNDKNAAVASSSSILPRSQIVPVQPPTYIPTHRNSFNSTYID
uniref:Major facilitator superfamily (MFS) profile domain-containing protein n=1 Tax=Panagrolaimus sp. PS1159 TaxID=55785 RepID=A0AC35EVL2_9BILA